MQYRPEKRKKRISISQPGLMTHKREHPDVTRTIFNLISSIRQLYGHWRKRREAQSYNEPPRKLSRDHRHTKIVARAAITNHTKFDEFLYATIGEESNGMLLSVLSALARRGWDPWEEASRLAQLPRDEAMSILAELASTLPCESMTANGAAACAKRLIALLPVA
jgi:hypothetical protein